MTNYNQEKVNELLHNAWKAYNNMIQYAEWANEYPSENEMFDVYDSISMNYLSECRIWLKAWSVMTDIKMQIWELSKFEAEDFESVIMQ